MDFSAIGTLEPRQVIVLGLISTTLVIVALLKGYRILGATLATFTIVVIGIRVPFPMAADLTIFAGLMGWIAELKSKKIRGGSFALMSMAMGVCLADIARPTKEIHIRGNEFQYRERRFRINGERPLLRIDQVEDANGKVIEWNIIATSHAANGRTLASIQANELYTDGFLSYIPAKVVAYKISSWALIEPRKIIRSY